MGAERERKASGFSESKVGSLCTVLSDEGHDLTDLTRDSGCCVEKKLQGGTTEASLDGFTVNQARDTMVQTRVMVGVVINGQILDIF